ncbi:MAG: DUF2847 family protein [Candidatus Vecturithrix sp.]|jgi:bacillithiol system protein YtxJ|nr:DUF2847 family protein [Candidatus Vecturithrix sp.]
MKQIQTLHSVVDWEHLQPEMPASGMIIFKFSPICPISRGVERDFDAWYAQLSEEVAPLCVKINVIEARPLSQHLAQLFHVQHESPQVIWLTSDRRLFWSASHHSIHPHTLTVQLHRLTTQR